MTVLPLDTAVRENIIVPTPNEVEVVKFNLTPASLEQAVNDISAEASLPMPLMLQVKDMQLSAFLQLLTLAALRLSINSSRLVQVASS